MLQDNKKQIREFTIEFIESKESLVYCAIFASMGLQLDLNKFFKRLRNTIENEFVDSLSDNTRNNSMQITLVKNYELIKSFVDNRIQSVLELISLIDT